MPSFKRPKRAKKNQPVSSHMVQRIQEMANTTYQVIAGDVQQCREEMGERPRDLTRDEVVEMVCDADYMLSNGRDQEAYKVWCSLPYEQAIQIVRMGFPHGSYE